MIHTVFINKEHGTRDAKYILEPHSWAIARSRRAVARARRTVARGCRLHRLLLCVQHGPLIFLKLLCCCLDNSIRFCCFENSIGSSHLITRRSGHLLLVFSLMYTATTGVFAWVAAPPSRVRPCPGPLASAV